MSQASKQEKENGEKSEKGRTTAITQWGEVAQKDIVQNFHPA